MSGTTAGLPSSNSLSGVIATIREYFVQRNGHLVALSSGNELSTLLGSLFSELSLSMAENTTALTDPVRALAALEQLQATEAQPVLLVEHLMKGHDLRFLVCQFREAYPDLRMIVLTADFARERVMLLREMGADLCLAIPLSFDALTESIAKLGSLEGRDSILAREVRGLLHGGKAEQALALCHKLLKRETNKAMGYVLLGDALRQLNKPFEARAAYEEAVGHGDAFMTPLKRLADMARETGQVETRLLFLYRMDELSPLNAERKIEMGTIHLQLGQSREADRLFEKALQLADKEATLRISAVSERIANLFSELDPSKAEHYLRRKPVEGTGQQTEELVFALNRLGLALRSQGRWTEALAEYHRAVQLSPNDSVLYYNMGMACLEGNDLQAAAQHMSKALVLNPRLPYSGDSVAFNMGMAFLKSNNTAKGFHCMKMAIEQNPGYEEARMALHTYGVAGREGYE